MNREKESFKRKSRFRTLLAKGKKLIAIFAALAVDKHLDYNQDEIIKEEDRNDKEKDDQG